MPRHAGRPRVAILHTGFVPRYRVRFHELLHQLSDIEYVVFHGDPPARTGHAAAPGPFTFPNVRTANRQIRLAGRTLIYQPIVRRVLASPWDAMVLAPYVRLLSNLLLAPLLRARGTAIVAWGHGLEKEEDHGASVRAALGAMGVVKAALARRVDGYLVYSPRGARYLESIGVPSRRIQVVPNTLDMAEASEHRARLDGESDAAIRERLGLRPASAVLLYIGRMYTEKRAGDLVEVIRRLRAADPGLDVEGVIIGDGPELPAIRAAAAGVEGVHVRGEVHDPDVIARHMRVAAAVVLPGKTGLAINHAFAHGVPVITRESRLHPPEIDYIEPDVNGLVVSGGLDDLAAAIAAVIRSPGRREALARGALETAERLTLEAMVRAFDEGVRAAIGRRRAAAVV